MSVFVCVYGWMCRHTLLYGQIETQNRFLSEVKPV